MTTAERLRLFVRQWQFCDECDAKVEQLPDNEDVAVFLRRYDEFWKLAIDEIDRVEREILRPGLDFAECYVVGDHAIVNVRQPGWSGGCEFLIAKIKPIEEVAKPMSESARMRVFLFANDFPAALASQLVALAHAVFVEVPGSKPVAWEAIKYSDGAVEVYLDTERVLDQVNRAIDRIHEAREMPITLTRFQRMYLAELLDGDKDETFPDDKAAMLAKLRADQPFTMGETNAG